MRSERPNRSSKILTIVGLTLTIGGVAAALAAALGSGAGAWTFRVGFDILRYAFYAVAAGGVIGLLHLLWRLRNKSVPLMPNLLAVVIALGFSFYLLSMVSTARSVPAIHDASTNLDDLPQFRTLPLRADNLEKVPDMDRSDLKAMDPESRWKAIHKEAYGDLRTLRLPLPPSEALARAEALVEDRGWDLAQADRQGGTIEATATTLFFRFKDDVVIRVRPDPANPRGSLVDMRSVSRVGGSDVGVNAKRIRSFLQDLQATGAQ